MHIFAGLNEEQRKAVLHTEGPLLVLAGAGSGKTRALTHRIAYLIQEKGVLPWHILAITFTNKAAQEMQERVEALVGDEGFGAWISTFHSLCVRILRQHIEHLGYGRHFAIYDGDDQKSIIKNLIKRMDIDRKLFKERDFLSYISHQKNQMRSPEACLSELSDYASSRERIKARLYAEYEKALQAANALDFDDLLLRTVELFADFPQVLESYQDRFHYILVDEYQDTNAVQFALIGQLAAKRGNICVVGDDDQSIYRFRGADIRNILDFEQQFPQAKVVKLEQNYRSTQTILDAANGVISHNRRRKEKRLWSSNKRGEKIAFRQWESGQEEAAFVAQTIAALARQQGAAYGDMAVLYRTNAQSRAIEEQLVRSGLPYRMIGGLQFYARREVKDILAYLRILANPLDALSLRRIVNVPRRSIGEASLERLENYGAMLEGGLLEAMSRAASVPGLGRAKAKVEAFAALLAGLGEKAGQGAISALVGLVVEQTGYEAYMMEAEEDWQERMANIWELEAKALQYEREASQPTLEGFLEEVALVSDADMAEEGQSRVTLMTLHGAKGLEFPYVFMVGMEEGLFPSLRCVASEDAEDMEEERRLAYVGITRAKERLFLTCARSRFLFGEEQRHGVSPFVLEIPEELLTGDVPRKPGPLPWEREGGLQRPRPAAYGRPGSAPMAEQPYKRGGGLPGLSKGMEPAGDLGYAVGDTVSHVKFGQGLVRRIEEAPGGQDKRVTVDFEGFGTKIVSAAFAKLKKVD